MTTARIIAVRVACAAAVAAVGTAAASAIAEEMLIDERFHAGGQGAWKIEVRAAAVRSLAWPGADDAPGLRFTSQGLDLAWRECPVGSAPFELAVDLALDRGRAEPWRTNGVIVCLSSAPIDRMGPKDLAVLFAPLQQGVVATVVRDKPLWGVEKRPGVWNQTADDVAARFVTTMKGAGGHCYSVTWPQQSLAGIRLRFHAWRDGQNVVRLTLYNADGAAGPWWEAEAPLPADLRDAQLRYVTVSTSRNAQDFADPGRPVPARSVVSGVVQRLRVRRLAAGEGPAFAESFPAAVLPTAPAAGPSMFLPREGGLAELRRKFGDPSFADYRTVLLRNALPEAVSRIAQGGPAHSRRIQALLWAYILSGVAEYKDRLLAEIDALIGPTDVLPARQSGFPGRLRQMLDVREFMGHNAEALAEAYDLLGDELDRPRRQRICFLLARAARNYLDRVAENDWWYANNPSNTTGVAGGTMGICGLALRADQPELSRQVVQTALKTMAKSYAAVRPDGSCVEGSMYWNYGLSYPVMLGWCLRNVTGDDGGLLSSQALKNAHQYMALNLGGDGQNVPFNDTQIWSMGWYLAALSGSEFDQPLARWLADRMAAEYAAQTDPDKRFPEQSGAGYAVLAFLLRDRKPAPREFPGVPAVLALEGVQEGIIRSDGAQFIPGLVTAIKGKGAVSTHHAQEDQGSFVLYADGEMFLLDPGYFEGKAASHSLPLIGDPSEAKLDPRAPCPILDVWQAGDLRSMTVDATRAYAAPGEGKTAAAERVRRIFVQVADKALIVLDDVVPAGGRAVTAQYQAGFPAEVRSDGAAVITGRKGTVTIFTFGPDLRLATTPRRFSKNWVYAKKGTVWVTISGQYRADPARPLVTVLARAAAGQTPPPATVDYPGEAVCVTLPGTPRVTFKKGPAGWTAQKP